MEAKGPRAGNGAHESNRPTQVNGAHIGKLQAWWPSTIFSHAPFAYLSRALPLSKWRRTLVLLQIQSAILRF